MRVVRGLTFVLCFCLDIQVRAEAHHANCWGKFWPCVESAGASRRTLVLPELQVTLGPGSVIQQQDKAVFQLVLGEFYIEVSQATYFKTPYARISCAGECKAIFVRKSDRITVKSLLGEWSIQPTGDATMYALVAGLQTQIGEVGENGTAKIEFPQSLPWAGTIEQWGQLHSGGVEDFKSKLKDFRPVWRSSVRNASEMHLQQVQRELASQDRRTAAAQARERARAQEALRLRQLFREKNYLDP